MVFNDPYMGMSPVTVRVDTSCGGCKQPDTEVTISGSLDAYGLIKEAYMRIPWYRKEPEGEKRPTPSEVIANGPATIVLWKDKTKTVTKCHDGDKYNGIFGILACAVRKLTKNKGKGVDHCEDVLRDIARYSLTIEDYRVLSDALAIVADALEIDGVGPAVAAHKWEPKPKEEPKEEPKGMPVITAITDPYGTHYEVMTCADDDTRFRERTRQAIRELIDKGEL